MTTRTDPLSLETTWRLQAERRRFIIRLMLFLIVTSVFVLFAIWFWLTQPLLSKPRPNPYRTVDPTRLEAHVKKLSVELSPRDETQLENLDRVSEYIRNEFEQAGASVSYQPYRREGRSFRNVIGTFGPEISERIIIGAHYDAAGPLPGADDNASGVAGLIELGRLLSKQQLKTRVELVAFTLEEPPYFRTNGMGSAVHAESLRKQNVHVKAMMSLEMIGYFSDKPNSQHFPAAILQALYPSRGNFVAVAGRVSDGWLARRIKAAMLTASPLPVFSINAPSFIPGIDFSDQVNYWDAGYSAVMITDTAFYRNPNYHTEHDTAEKLDYNRMAMVVEGVFAAVVTLDGG